MRARTASGNSTAQNTRHSLRWFKDERLLRGLRHRCSRKRQLAWRHRTPISELIAPVRILRQSRLAERDPLLRLVPITRISNQSHRHTRTDIHRRTNQPARSILRKRRNCELRTNQRRRSQRMWKARLLNVAPRPLRLICAEVLRERPDRLVITRAQQIAVTRKLFRQPRGRLHLEHAIERRVEVAPLIVSYKPWSKRRRQDLRTKSQPHRRSNRRHCRFSVDSPVPLLKRIERRFQLLIGGRQLRSQQLHGFFRERNPCNRVNISLDATKIITRELWLFTQQIEDAARAIRLCPRVREKVWIIGPDNSLVRSDDDSRRRIKNRRQLRHGNVAGPLARVSRSVVRNTAVTRLPDRHHASRVITNVTVDIRVDDVLRGRGKRFERRVELLPVVRAI